MKTNTGSYLLHYYIYIIYVNSKSTSVQIWLFGYELSDTIIGMTKDKMVIITSKKKAEFLKPLTSSKGSENYEGIIIENTPYMLYSITFIYKLYSIIDEKVLRK